MAFSANSCCHFLLLTDASLASPEILLVPEHLKPNFLEAVVKNGLFFAIAFFLPFPFNVSIQDQTSVGSYINPSLILFFVCGKGLIQSVCTS